MSTNSVDSGLRCGHAGSVRKPGNPGGTWSYRLDLGLDAEGGRLQKQVGGFRTKKDAQAALNDALSGIQRGTYVAPSRQTLAAFLDQWLQGARTELALTAWTAYEGIVPLEYEAPTPDLSLGIER